MKSQGRSDQTENAEQKNQAKNTPDDLKKQYWSLTWAPLEDLNNDQITDLRNHNILASNGRRMIQFYHRSKILDGLDENNIKNLENL